MVIVVGGLLGWFCLVLLFGCLSDGGLSWFWWFGLRRGFDVVDGQFRTGWVLLLWGVAVI